MSDRSVVVCKRVFEGEPPTMVSNDNGHLSACCSCGEAFSERISLSRLKIVHIGFVTDENGAKTTLENLPGNSIATLNNSHHWEYNCLGEPYSAEAVPKGAQWMPERREFLAEFDVQNLKTLIYPNGEIVHLYTEEGTPSVLVWSNADDANTWSQRSPSPVIVADITNELVERIPDRIGTVVVDPEAEDYQRVIPKSYLSGGFSVD